MLFWYGKPVVNISTLMMIFTALHELKGLNQAHHAC